MHRTGPTSLMYCYPFQKIHPLKTYRNCIFIRVVEALFDLGLRLKSKLTIVKGLIKLTKTLLEYNNVYFTLDLIKKSGSYHT